ncbi:hypothetical protein L2E82_21855 [Cichorium intybus]|uniref:Uncharacterized protein n=1 Tax=Cichorium intybus TaxID=13427 RepID=A0ACB9DWC1_CICIN|nr:hypothetical protein L2E82_21855 [Cichorium intybus]
MPEGMVREVWRAREQVLEEQEGWKKVERRSHGRRSNRKEDYEDVKKITTTFFVTNLPVSCSSSILWKSLMKYGYSVDAFVPEKKNKAGCVFAFVRFIKIQNVGAMVNTLNKVFIGGRKIQVNVAKYQRLQRPDESRDVQRRTSHAMDGKKERIGGFINVTRGHSFRDVLAGSRVQPCDKENERNAMISIPDVVNLSAPPWLDYCLIGEIKDIELLSNFFSIFHESGIAECSLKYVGGLLVLIKFESKVTAKAFLDDQRDTWSNWFAWLKEVM